MNDTIDTISSLRSVHGDFNDREVTEEDLRTVLRSAVNAASSSSRQAYSAVIVRDKEVMRQFGYTGSVMLVFCVDLSRHRRLAEAKGYVYHGSDISDFVNASFDTAIALQTAVTAAKSIGIDSLITNCIHRVDLDTVYEKLNLPRKLVFPLMAAVFGYSDAEHKKKVRLDDDTIFHRETYNPMTDQQCSDTYEFYDTEYTGMIGNERWLDLGFDSYLDWLYGGWLKMRKEEGREDSARHQMHGILERAGFWKT